MTSGHGGPPGTPEDQSGRAGTPQGWNALPAQPYGQPPAQPYGQPPAYAPAPPPPLHQGAPPAMERPTTVRAGIGAFVASLVLGLVGAAVTLGQLDDLAAQQANVGLTEDAIRAGLIVGSVIGLVIVALEVLVLRFAWKGHNWARIVLWVLGAIGIVSGLAGLAGENPLGGFAAALGVFQWLLTIAGVVLLALKPSNEWYRYRGWQRANGQG